MSDSTSNLDTIQTAQSQKEVTANGEDDAESTGSFGGRRWSTCSGLTWGYYGGKYPAGGAAPAITMLANGTNVLVASATNYQEFDAVAGTVTVNQTAFTPGRWPLYEITTGAAAVTSYIDKRTWGAPVNPRVTVNMAGAADVTLTQAQARADILVLTGVLTGNVKTIVPLQPHAWDAFNDTTGAFTLTVIGATGTGVVIASGKCARVTSDGTNVRRISPDT